MNKFPPGDMESPSTAAFLETYRKFRAATVFTVVQATRARFQDAEDAVQEAAVGTWRALNRSDGKTTIQAQWGYLTRSAINAQKKQSKKNREKPREDVIKLLDRRTRIREAEEADLWARRRAWLPEAIRRLPESERDVVILRLRDRCDGEISQQLGIADHSVPVIHSRAVARLRGMAFEQGLMTLAA